ncbi:hypothetical protein [Microtetraspora malaysiensis]|uniref:hypothetical protein n=1 Tax=Microtetraspora malaysiensis TaxID=161358 RepID=UPI0012F9E8EC|nr:hypothetical protein [Microtetraspora malaysiensis]
MLAGVVFLLAGINGCMSEGVDNEAKLCLDRANRENALFRHAISAVLPADQVLSIDEFNGCDSANNGAWLKVRLAPKLGEQDVWKRFQKAGWSAGGAVDSDLRKQVGRRIIGVLIAAGREPGMTVEVTADDSCWDDNGYRCD